MITLPIDKHVWNGVLDKDGGVKLSGAIEFLRAFQKDLKTKQIVFNLMRLIDEVFEKMEKFYFKDKNNGNEKNRREPVLPRKIFNRNAMSKRQLASFFAHWPQMRDFVSPSACGGQIAENQDIKLKSN